MDALSATMKFLRDQSFAQGMKALNDAIENPEGPGSTWVKGIAQSFVPYSAGMRNAAQVQDATVREPGADADVGFLNSLYQRMKRDIPWAAGSIDEKINAMGLPAQRPTGAGVKALWPVSTSQAAGARRGLSPERSEEAVASAELERLRMAVGLMKPDVVVDGKRVRLTPEEKRGAAIGAGGEARQAVAEMVRSDGWKSLSDSEKRAWIKEIVRKARTPHMQEATLLAAERSQSQDVERTVLDEVAR